MAFIPVIGQALAAVLMVVSAVTAIASAVLKTVAAAQGQTSWLDAGLSILGAALACTGLGALKGGLAAAKAAGGLKGLAGLGAKGILTGTGRNMLSAVKGIGGKGLRLVKNLASKTARNDIQIAPYKILSKARDIPGQAHHLNQNAAFRKIIPRSEGMAIKLEGNILTDAGSPHWAAHKSLESFWDAYRKGGALDGVRPTVSDYNLALRASLKAAGLSPGQVTQAMDAAIAQQLKYGLTGVRHVPRIPGRITGLAKLLL